MDSNCQCIVLFKGGGAFDLIVRRSALEKTVYLLSQDGCPSPVFPLGGSWFHRWREGAFPI